MAKLRVAIADDHAAVRAGVRALLEVHDDLEIVGEAADAPGAVRLAAMERPDVLLLDLGMPGGGIRAIAPTLQAHAGLRVLVFTMHDSLPFLRAALAAGAHGYIVKTARGDDLARAIRTVHDGRFYADVSVAGGSVTLPNTGARSTSTLSVRERQVLSDLAHGYTQREIAGRLDLSVRTVETYRTRITEKLGLQSRVDIVRYALEMGLLTPNQNDTPSDGEGPLHE